MTNEEILKSAERELSAAGKVPTPFLSTQWKHLCTSAASQLMSKRPTALISLQKALLVAKEIEILAEFLKTKQADSKEEAVTYAALVERLRILSGFIVGHSEAVMTLDTVWDWD